MKLKKFQKQDLARAALHDGLILSWDTGLGKTWALYLWPLVKLGYTREPLGLAPYYPPKVADGGRAFAPNTTRLRPKGPVLIVAPGDLHQQIVDEAWTRFGIAVFPLDCQATFGRLTSSAHSARTNLDPDGRPVLAPDFYITSYSQLTTNGVDRIPDARTFPDPVALRQLLCLQNGEHVPLSAVQEHCHRNGVNWPEWAYHPDFTTTCEFFAWRGIKWRNEYSKFGLDPATATKQSLQAAYDTILAQLAERRDEEQAEKDRAKAQEEFETLQMLVPENSSPNSHASHRPSAEVNGRFIADPDPSHPSHSPEPRFADLEIPQQDFVLRHFLFEYLLAGSVGDGETHTYEKLDDGTWRTQGREKREEGSGQRVHSSLSILHAPASVSEAETVPPAVIATRRIKCLYSASLSDLSYNAFRAVVVDEGVKMKGADTYVGAGVRQMDPEYRLVLTATPVKNRVPDLFWLAHWATGGKAEAHARFPYRNDVSEQTAFAETFMVTEHNKTREENAAEAGAKVSSSRYKKLTAEVCNIHRLWKLLGPIVLRRRKDDCGEDIVPKIRKVIRCKMGTRQADVIAYHLQCAYTDIKGEEAIGARLQALRMAAADPTSLHLKAQPGEPHKDCRCTKKPVPPEVQLQRLQKEREKLLASHASPDSHNSPSPKEEKEFQAALARLDEEIATPVPRFDSIPAEKACSICSGTGRIPLPERSGQPFIPKHASVLNLVAEILARGEQVVIGAAFNDPLDLLSGWLTEASVRHLKLDGRTSQKKRGVAASQFKRGRVALRGGGLASAGAAGNSASDAAIPVMLAGVECMSEGHSFDLANNVILLAYSWALDKFIQFINRVHRMTSRKPVNVYVVICDGTMDRKLESLVQEKGDSSELVLDGRLLGERSEEINLAQLLQVAQREFDAGSDTLDEALVHAQWPALRDRLRTAMAQWDQTCEVRHVAAPPAPQPRTTRAHPSPLSHPSPGVSGKKTVLRYDPATGKYLRVEQTTTVLPKLPPPPPVGVPPSGGSAAGQGVGVPPSGGRASGQGVGVPPSGGRASGPSPDWQSALRPKSARPNLVTTASTVNLWDLL